jgi:hypothetical protein
MNNVSCFVVGEGDFFIRGTMLTEKMKDILQNFIPNYYPYMFDVRTEIDPNDDTMLNVNVAIRPPVSCIKASFVLNKVL